jgi:hypothetical protein
MLFTEGLSKPLRGWVKAFRTNTLHDTIMRTQDVADTMPKKVSIKPFIPQKVRRQNPSRSHG